MDDLIERLRALPRHEHSDYSIGDEAADALEAALEDAERYRWLRVNEQDRSDVFLACCFEELDAAIDAARKEARDG